MGGGVDFDLHGSILLPRRQGLKAVFPLATGARGGYLPDMSNFTKTLLGKGTLALALTLTPMAVAQDVEEAEEGGTGAVAEAPINETANQIDQAAAAQAEAGAEGPSLDASDEGDAAETVEGDIRDQSYENSGIDQQVANALSEQGYFAAGLGDSRESFTKALKNFQTLNGMEPTGVITPEVLSKLGVLSDEFSPQ